jgi:hypothetical protein
MNVHAQRRSELAIWLVLWAVITPWWLVGIARGEHNLVLPVLVIVHAVTFLAASIYFSYRS